MKKLKSSSFNRHPFDPCAATADAEDAVQGGLAADGGISLVIPPLQGNGLVDVAGEVLTVLPVSYRTGGYRYIARRSEGT